jgi:hypothetical protein
MGVDRDFPKLLAVSEETQGVKVLGPKGAPVGRSLLFNAFYLF